MGNIPTSTANNPGFQQSPSAQRLPFIERKQGPDFGAAIASVGQSLVEATKAKERLDSASKGGGGLDPQEELLLAEVKKELNNYASGLTTTDAQGNFVVDPKDHLEAYDKRVTETTDLLTSRGVRPAIVADVVNWSVTSREKVRDNQDRYANGQAFVAFGASGNSNEAENKAGNRTLDEIIAQFGAIQGTSGTLAQNRFTNQEQLARQTDSLYKSNLFSGVRGLSSKGLFEDARRLITAASAGGFVTDQADLERAEGIVQSEGKEYVDSQATDLVSSLANAAESDTTTSGSIDPFGRWDALIKAHPLSQPQIQPAVEGSGVNLVAQYLQAGINFVESKNSTLGASGTTQEEADSLNAIVRSAERWLTTFSPTDDTEDLIGDFRESLAKAKETALEVGKDNNDKDTLISKPPSPVDIQAGTDERIRSETNDAIMQKPSLRAAYFTAVGAGTYDISGGASEVIAGLESSDISLRNDAFKAISQIYDGAPGSPSERRQRVVDALRSMQGPEGKGKEYAVVASAFLDPNLSDADRQIFREMPLSRSLPILNMMGSLKTFADREEAKIVAAGGDVTRALGEGSGTLTADGKKLEFDITRFNKDIAIDMHDDPSGFDSEGNAFSLNGVAEVSNAGLIERVEAQTTAVLLRAAKGGTDVDLQVVMQTVKELKDQMYSQNLVALDQPANQANQRTLAGVRFGGYPVSSMLYIGKDGPFVSDGTRNDARIKSMQRAIADLPVVKADEEGWGEEHFIDFQNPMTGEDNNVVEFPIRPNDTSVNTKGFLRVEFEGDNAKVTIEVSPSEGMSPQARLMDRPDAFLRSFGWRPQYGPVTLEDFDPSGYRLSKYADMVDRYYPYLSGDMRRTKIIEEIYNDGWAGVRSNQGGATA